MHFKIVLILAIAAQVLAALLALRLNWKYRSHSAWIMISAAAWLIALQQVALLVIVWNVEAGIMQALPLWTACLSALLVSVLFVGGVALVEPLFVQISKAQKLLERENRKLEEVVHETEEELEIARQIQQRLLPSEAPEISGFDIAGGCEPAAWTSGDYFDYISVDDDRWLLVVADVTGHGIGPSLLTASTRSILRMLARNYDDPHEILTLANQAIAKDVEFGRFVTMFLVKFEPRRRKCTYCGAGHDGYLLREDGESLLLQSQGPPLGASESFVFESSTSFQISSHDILLLFSDGIPESESPNGEQFGNDRMTSTIHESRDQPASQIRDHLFDTVRAFTLDATQHDDITLVVVKAAN